MVVGVFPIAKLGGLLLRQVSKPIANFAKERAKQNPVFRKYVCMPPAQFYNWCEVKMKMWILNLGKPDTVPSLNEQAAIELGANLLGEGIIFVIAAAIIYLEYARQVRKEAVKETLRKEELDTLSFTIRDLSFRVEGQEAEIRHLANMVSSLDGRVMKIPWKIFSDSSNTSNADVNNNNNKNNSTKDSESKSTDSNTSDGLKEAIIYVSDELLMGNNRKQS